MNEDSKTYLFGDSKVDPNLLLAMNGNGGGFGGGAWNNPIWALAFLAFLGNGNFGFGGNKGNDINAIREQLNNNQNSGLLMDAIKGNSASLTTLASNLNLNINAVTAAINGIQTQICNLGSQYGMGSQQTINAIESGNCALQNAFQQCCCENKLLTTQQGYENRIANSEQTAILGGKIDAQTTLLNDKFCQLEMREMQNKLDALREKNTQLQGIIDNANQTASIQNYVATLVTPLQKEVTEIANKMPNTVSVPYPQLAAVPQAYANSLYSYGYGLTPYGNGSIWS